MPRITAPGEHARTVASAPSIEARTCVIIEANSVSVPTGVSGITTRAIWFVTPRGRMASNSGCTTVLVAGARTPNLKRGASASGIGRLVYRRLAVAAGGFRTLEPASRRPARFDSGAPDPLPWRAAVRRHLFRCPLRSRV
jgi:hypothetical protein